MLLTVKYQGEKQNKKGYYHNVEICFMCCLCKFFAFYYFFPWQKINEDTKARYLLFIFSPLLSTHTARKVTQVPYNILTKQRYEYIY